jgi:glutathione S-transferase
MKLFNSMGPNPHVVRMFAAEKNMSLEIEDIDLMAGANRQEAYLAKNPAGQSPCLETDNGTLIAEITAICEYLDEVGGGDSLIGNTPEEKAVTRMWARRVDLNICEPLATGFRYSEGLPIFKDRMITIPEAADGLKEIARNRLSWLNDLMTEGDYISGSSICLADVLLFCFLKFGQSVGQPYDTNLQNIHSWFERISHRESASA